jgi:hypothetical protein
VELAERNPKRITFRDLARPLNNRLPVPPAHPFSPTSRGIKQSFDPLDRGNTLLREFGGVADRLAGLKQPRNVAMLVQQP